MVGILYQCIRAQYQRAGAPPAGLRVLIYVQCPNQLKDCSNTLSKGLDQLIEGSDSLLSSLEGSNQPIEASIVI